MEVDIVQLAPLATFNVVCHDILETTPDEETSDPDAIKDSTVVVAIGTDTTDLIVTNGTKLWIRNIPIGGNHFTKQLSRELKLTLAKAEHLKRNARKAEDPKTVFQAMRPVFTDLVTEIQRSLSFYQSMEKTSNVQRIVLLGNAAQLPGLRQFMTSQLQLDIAKVTEFRHLSGPGVIDQKSFADNVLSLAPCYGLCLQGLKRSRLTTNLLPYEFVLSRMIEAKKPWVLASVGALMLGSVIMLLIQASAWYRVNPDYSDGSQTWRSAMANARPVSQRSSQFKSEDEELKTKLRRINAISDELSSASETQTDWLELFYAISQVLPKDPRMTEDKTDIPFKDREEVYLDYIETKYVRELFTWYAGIGNKQGIQPIHDFQFIFVAQRDLQEAAKEAASTIKRIDDPNAKAEDAGVTGPGWVIEIHGHHFHNSQEAFDRQDSSYAYVIKHLLKEFVTGSVKFEGAENEIDGGGEYKFSDFGVFYPTLVSYTPNRQVTMELPKAIDATGADENATGNNVVTRKSAGGGKSGETGPDDSSKAQTNSETVDRCDFVIQFAWLPRSHSERFKAKQLRLKHEAAERKQQSTQAANNNSTQ